MGGIPIIVIVVFLVIWVLTNVLRAQQDDARTNRRPPVGPANRPPNQPMERNTATDIDRFLAEIDRLRQKGTTQEETPSAQRPAPAPATAPTLPRPRPQPPRPQPVATRPRPQPRPAPAPRPVVTPPLTPAVAAPPPPPPTPAPPPRPQSAPTQTLNAIDARFAEASRQLDRTTLPAAPPAAAAPSARKPPQAGSAMEIVQTLFKGRKGAAAAILVSEILGKPKSKRHV